jgi:hypothetical protein
MRNWPADYVGDGILLAKNKSIKEVVRRRDEKLGDKIILRKKLKGLPELR